MNKTISIKEQLNKGISKQEILYNMISYPMLYCPDGLYEFADDMTDEELRSFKSRAGTYLHIATTKCDLKMVKYFLSRGLDVNCESGILSGGSLIRGALRTATPIANAKQIDKEKLKEIKEIIKILLENGADLHHQIKLGTVNTGNFKPSTIIEVITKLVPLKDEEIVNMVKEYYYKDVYNENK